jgi:uncharacterized protein YbjT (DUF2867 family)
MFVVAGVTGNTGGMVANSLLAHGKPVNALVRDPGKAEAWRAKGAHVTLAALDDVGALTPALSNAEGAYLLIPPNYAAADFLADRARFADALAKAVEASQIPHVVYLSSIGAQHSAGTGPIRNNHYAESILSAAARNLTILRPAFFLQNWAQSVEGVRTQGVLHNFLTPGRKMPMISTVDIGRIAAEALLDRAQGRRILELAGPEEYSPDDIAQLFSEKLGRPVCLETHSLDAVVPTFTAAGFSPEVAALLQEMYDGINSRLVTFEGGSAQFRRGIVTAGQAIAGFLAH